MTVGGVAVQLYYSPNSPYARKARIIIHELDLESRVEETIVTLPADAKFRSINPLGKIPALVLDDGEVLIDSAGIIDMLHEMAGPQKALIPPSGAARLKALRLIGTRGSLIYAGDHDPTGEVVAADTGFMRPRMPAKIAPSDLHFTDMHGGLRDAFGLMGELIAAVPTRIGKETPRIVPRKRRPK